MNSSGASLLQEWVAGVGLDHDDALGPEGLRQALQDRHRHAVQPGQDGRIPDQPGPHPVERLAPQDGRHGQCPGERRAHAHRAADLVGERQRCIARPLGEGRRVAHVQVEHPADDQARCLALPARGQGRRGENPADEDHGHDRGDPHDLRGQPPRVPVAQQGCQPERHEDQWRGDIPRTEPHPPPRLALVEPGSVSGREPAAPGEISRHNGGQEGRHHPRGAAAERELGPPGRHHGASHPHP